jgi:hypothetical protein
MVRDARWQLQMLALPVAQRAALRRAGEDADSARA